MPLDSKYKFTFAYPPTSPFKRDLTSVPPVASDPNLNLTVAIVSTTADKKIKSRSGEVTSPQLDAPTNAQAVSSSTGETTDHPGIAPTLAQSSVIVKDVLHVPNQTDPQTISQRETYSGEGESQLQDSHNNDGSSYRNEGEYYIDGTLTYDFLRLQEDEENGWLFNDGLGYFADSEPNYYRDTYENSDSPPQGSQNSNLATVTPIRSTFPGLATSLSSGLDANLSGTLSPRTESEGDSGESQSKKSGTSNSLLTETDSDEEYSSEDSDSDVPLANRLKPGRGKINPLPLKQLIATDFNIRVSDRRSRSSGDEADSEEPQLKKSGPSTVSERKTGLTGPVSPLAEADSDEGLSSSEDSDHDIPNAYGPKPGADKAISVPVKPLAAIDYNSWALDYNSSSSKDDSDEEYEPSPARKNRRPKKVMKKTKKNNKDENNDDSGYSPETHKNISRIKAVL